MSADEHLSQRLRALVLSHLGEEMPAPNHPDNHLLNDWAIYGPKDPRIEHLVSQLALDHGMRVAEIEEWIVLALKQLVMEREKNN
ncbi:MAG: hypothetical protein ACE369_07050 [Roseovarius sp.]